MIVVEGGEIVGQIWADVPQGEIGSRNAAIQANFGLQLFHNELSCAHWCAQNGDSPLTRLTLGISSPHSGILVNTFSGGLQSLDPPRSFSALVESASLALVRTNPRMLPQLTVRSGGRPVCSNAGPSAPTQASLLQRRPVSSMQARLLNAGPSECRPVCSNAGPSAPMQARLLNPNPSAQRRPACSMQTRLLSAGTSAQRRPVCPAQARLLNAAGPSAQCSKPVCSMQARLLNAGPSAQRRPFCSTQACLLNAGPSAQCRNVC